jgi:hypothetical protein
MTRRGLPQNVLRIKMAGGHFAMGAVSSVRAVACHFAACLRSAPNLPLRSCWARNARLLQHTIIFMIYRAQTCLPSGRRNIPKGLRMQADPRKMLADANFGILVLGAHY